MLNFTKRLWRPKSACSFIDCQLALDAKQWRDITGTKTLKKHWINPIRNREKFLINGPGGDRFDATHSNVNNSRITKDKKSAFALQEAQFCDKKSKLFSLYLQPRSLINFNISQGLSETISSLFSA